MSVPPFRFVDFCFILFLGAICLVSSVLLFAPNIEEARGEARASSAYNWVKTRESLGTEDPWGEPYLEKQLPDGSTHIFSKGPNRTSPETGFDDDDIYASMPEHPNAEIYRDKQRQWFVVRPEFPLVGIKECRLLEKIAWIASENFSPSEKALDHFR